MDDSAIKPVWAPFHVPLKGLNLNVEKSCLKNCACPHCDGVLRGRLFFITHWSNQRYDTASLAQTYENRLSSWLRPRFWRLRRKPRVNVIGCMSHFSDYFASSQVYVYSSLVLLPQEVEWAQPWIKMLMRAGERSCCFLEGDVSFQEWATISSCPMESGDPHTSYVRFYRAVLHQLYWSGESSSRDETEVVQVPYGDLTGFQERMTYTFPNLDRTILFSSPGMDDLQRFAQEHLHPQWIPGKGIHSVCSLWHPLQRQRKEYVK